MGAEDGQMGWEREEKDRLGMQFDEEDVRSEAAEGAGGGGGWPSLTLTSLA